MSGGQSVAEPRSPADAGPHGRRLDGIAAAGLAGSAHRLVLEDMDDGEWSRLLRAVERERLLGLLLSAVEGQQCALPAERKAEVVERHRASMARTLLLEREVLRCVGVLAGAGIETRVLKGSAVARLDYANPSQRPFGDVDLMVRSEDLQPAVSVLSTAGFRRASHAISSAFDRRFSKGVTMVADDGTELDLHRTFVMGRFGLAVDLDEAWARPTPFVVGGCAVAALSPEARLLHAAYNAALGSWPVRRLPLRDVAEMVLFGTWEDARLRALSSSWGADAVLAVAVRDAWTTLRLEDETALSAWARHHEATTSDRRALGLHRRPAASYALYQLAALTALPWRQRVPYAWSLAVPSREFLQSRGSSLTGHLRTSVVRTLRG